jgi:hypothetical protein
MTTVNERLAEHVGTLSAQLAAFNLTLQKLEEIINGTAKSGGLKERIAVAEEEIKRNKESFAKIETGITTLRNEMLIEIGKIAATANAAARQKSDSWRDLGWSLLKAGLSVIVVGVVGIVFWQVIIWLAAHAPVR